MENVLLVIHLILAVFIIVVVLLQRSEGGALGIGGGGGGGLVSSRGASTALSKTTWALGAAFIITSLALTVIAAQNSSRSSVIDRLGAPGAVETPATEGVADDLKGLLEPPPAIDPAAPPAAD